MNPEKSPRSSNSSQRPFAGCVELIPPQPLFIEFVTTDPIWGFPIRQLSHFSLENNPDQQDKKTSPPDQLLLFYGTAVVVLRGWRLELMRRAAGQRARRPRPRRKTSGRADA